MSKSIQPLFESHVPRHMRLNAVSYYDDRVSSPAMHEVVEYVPVLDDQGHLVVESPVVVERPAADSFRQYRHSDFRLEAMLQAGVRLSEISYLDVSRRQCDDLVDKAISLGLLSEDFVSLNQDHSPAEPPVESSNT